MRYVPSNQNHEHANPTRPVSGRAGHVKCGVKSENGAPRSVDYFVLKPCQDAYGVLVETWRTRVLAASKSDKLTIIPIVFESDDPSKVCFNRLVLEDSAGNEAQFTDGQTLFWAVNEGWKSRPLAEVLAAKNMSFEDYQLESAQKVNNPKGWHEKLTLRFALPSLPIAGHWEFTTKASKSSIRQIVQVFDHTLETRGTVKGMLFTLSVEMHKSKRSGVARRFPVVSLAPAATQAQAVALIEAAAQKMALLSNPNATPELP